MGQRQRAVCGMQPEGDLHARGRRRAARPMDDALRAGGGSRRDEPGGAPIGDGPWRRSGRGRAGARRDVPGGVVPGRDRPGRGGPGRGAAGLESPRWSPPSLARSGSWAPAVRQRADRSKSSCRCGDGGHLGGRGQDCRSGCCRRGWRCTAERTTGGDVSRASWRVRARGSRVACTPGRHVPVVRHARTGRDVHAARTDPAWRSTRSPRATSVTTARAGVTKRLRAWTSAGPWGQTPRPGRELELSRPTENRPLRPALERGTLTGSRACTSTRLGDGHLDPTEGVHSDPTEGVHSDPAEELALPPERGTGTPTGPGHLLRAELGSPGPGRPGRTLPPCHNRDHDAPGHR